MSGCASFFQAPQQFTLLRREAIPELLARRPVGPLRIWCVDCGTGEDAYSLAITLEEMGLLGRCTILATDTSRAELETAERAEYPTASLRGPEAFRVQPFLADVAGSTGVTRRTLDSRIRRRVVFQRTDLASLEGAGMVSTFSDFDLIFCRTRLRELPADVQSRSVRVLSEALGEGGWLFVDPLDAPLESLASLSRIERPEGVCHRKVGGARRATTGSIPVPPSSTRSLRRTAIDDGVMQAMARLNGLANQGARELAERHAAQLCNANAESAELHYLHALALLDVGGRDADARAALERSLRLRPSFIPALLAIALLMQNAGEMESAEKTFSALARCSAELPPHTRLPLAGTRTAQQLAHFASARAQACAVTVPLRMRSASG